MEGGVLDIHTTFMMGHIAVIFILYTQVRLREMAIIAKSV